jgi:hypothetical protein
LKEIIVVYLDGASEFHKKAMQVALENMSKYTQTPLSRTCWNQAFSMSQEVCILEQRTILYNNIHQAMHLLVILPLGMVTTLSLT